VLSLHAPIRSRLSREELREKIKMSTTGTVVDQPNEKAEPQVQPKTEQHASPERSVDKFADARRAKKKAKRARHRARLRRSHTDG
jgi:hypothetical protein